MVRTRVWLDTDPGMGAPGSDIDDGLAILMLLGSPELQLEGVSVCFGNVPLAQALTCARRVLAAAASDAPIYAGAAAAAERGRPSPAVEAMRGAVDASPGEITLLAIGPLTNVATAMSLDRDFARKLRRLVVMGGAVHFPHFAEYGEFNFHQDGRAAAEVMTAVCPRTLVTMDLCAQATFRREHLDAMTSPGGAVADLLQETVPRWLDLWKRQWNLDGFFPWDPIAVAWLTHPELFDRRPCRFRVEPEGERQGRLLDFEEVAGDDPAPDAVDVPSRLDGDAFLSLLAERIGWVATRATGAHEPA